MSGILKELVFMGSAQRDLREFPEDVRQVFGFALYTAQRGDVPSGAVKMKGLQGVVELKESDADGTYRAMYTAKIKGKVVVLHAFQKKSKKGIATPAPDIEVIRERLKQAKVLWH